MDDCLQEIKSDVRGRRWYGYRKTKKGLDGDVNILYFDSVSSVSWLWCGTKVL